MNELEILELETRNNSRLTFVTDGTSQTQLFD